MRQAEARSAFESRDTSPRQRPSYPEHAGSYPASRGAVRAILLVLLTGLSLTGCAPPPELKRPPAAIDASTRSLLPPGRFQAATFPEATEGATVIVESGGRMTALRFASEGAAAAGFAEFNRRIAARRDLTSRSRVSLGSSSYARYAGPNVSGLAWTSGIWVFSAEAADAASVTAMIQASAAGGLGPGADSILPVLLLVAVLLVALLGLTIVMVRLVVKRLAIAPLAGAPVLSRTELVRRLLALNDAGRPYLVREGPEADVVVEWKFADATWWGVLAKSGLRKAYRLRLYLDDHTRQAFALDEFGEVDWNAGALPLPRVHYRSAFFRGIVLKKYDRGAAYGFRAPAGGQFEKVVDYTFDIDRVKRIVIDAVTSSGWTYQPALWPKRRRTA